MPFYNPGDRLPDPDWVLGDDAARGINQPPDNWMPDHQRHKVANARDELANCCDAIKGAVEEMDFVSIALDDFLPTLYEAMDKASVLFDEFHSETVGDDWNEPSGEREDYEDR